MKQLQLFLGLLLFTAAAVVAFIVVGWWLLLPVAVGALWQIAGHLAAKDQAGSQAANVKQPAQSAVATVMSKPPSTVTWQETVEAIERARPRKPEQA